MTSKILLGASLFALIAAQGALAQNSENQSSEVVVTASRADLLGKAVAASQGTVTREEIELRPIYRIGELYETIPGLVVTVHSG